MKVRSAKLGFSLAGFMAFLVLAQGAFSAIRTTAPVVTYSFAAFFASIFARLGSASEPMLLLILGASLIGVAVRIRQVRAAVAND